MSEIDQLLEIKADTTAVLDSLKELTKAVTDLATELKTMNEEWQRVKKAGKF